MASDPGAPVPMFPADPPSQRIYRRNLRQAVGDHIRDEILAGRWSVGTRIDQTEIATALGVSRIPIREALIELEGEGLVESIPDRGAFVAQLTQADVLDHLRIYGALTSIAAERAAELITDDQLARLSDLNVRLRAASEPAEQEQLNWDFHSDINVIGASRRLRATIRTFSRGLPRHFFNDTNTQGGDAAREHDDILVALRDRDAERAGSLMSAHFGRSAVRILNTLKAQGFWRDDQRWPGPNERNA